MASDWLKARPLWRGELESQVALGMKCELEALLSGGMDAIGEFVLRSITRCDYLS